MSEDYCLKLVRIATCDSMVGMLWSTTRRCDMFILATFRCPGSGAWHYSIPIVLALPLPWPVDEALKVV